MIDSPKSYPIALTLPPRKYSYWKPSQNFPDTLLYLSWGKRLFGKNPIPTTKHQGWAYMIVTSGKSILHIKEDKIPVNTYDFLVIPPNVPYGISANSSKCETEQFCWIWKNPPHQLPAASTENQWFHSSINPHHIPIIERLHIETRRQLESFDDQTIHALKGIRLGLDVEWIRTYSKKKEPTVSEMRFNQAVAWMQDHLEETRPIECLQDYLQISSTTLKRLFLSRTKQSPQNYFQDIKFKKAYEMLASSEHPSVKYVAITLGYKHMNDFTRAFQKHFSISPSSLTKSNTPH